MFDCISGGGFSSRCKSRIKMIRSRINVLKKRRRGTIDYLKNAMAELLKNGLDVNAYGRAEELISELNRLSCYEMIEQFCVCILEKLSSMRKQRDCPPETREAVSTLMFAAARIADLPELCDLRCIFTQRYGNAIESAISREFAEKYESKTPSMDHKLQLMRNISHEFSVNWDSKAFRGRISITSASDQVDKYQSIGKGKDGAVAKIDSDDAVAKVKISSYERQRTPPRISSHERQRTPSRISSNERQRTPPRISSHERQHTPPKHEVNSKAILPINTSNDCPPFSPNKLGHKGSAENLKPHCTNNVIPPYVKTKGSKDGTDMEIYHAGSDQSKPTDLSINNRGIACREEKTQVGLNGSGDENACNLEDSAVDAHLKLRSVRRKKQLKLLVQENYATAEDSEPVISRNRNGRRSRGTRQSICPTYDDDPDEEDMIMDELLIHYSKKSTDKSRRPPKGMKAPRASDASKSPLQNHADAHLNSETSFPPKGLRAHACASDASKSPLHQNKEEDHLKSGSSFPPSRAASLPSQRPTPTEVAKVPVRAASLEPNTLRLHVHPKLPDCDDLPARIAALTLRGEIRK